MAKGKKGKRRRRASFSILNALEAAIYGEILMRGTTGSGIISFFTGEGDIGIGPGETIGAVTTYSQPVGIGEISLTDLMQEPSLALATISSNFKSNLLPMSLAAFTTSISFRIGRRMLRRPLASVNRNLVKPVLGAGIRL
ncbi:MAG TPA: hypothetical protein EYN66_04225 [Myxococcales bacterium]|nr:hypothetical protein [Myxococcales bacterium]